MAWGLLSVVTSGREPTTSQSTVEGKLRRYHQTRVRDSEGVLTTTAHVRSRHLTLTSSPSSCRPSSFPSSSCHPSWSQSRQSHRTAYRALEKTSRTHSKIDNGKRHPNIPQSPYLAINQPYSPTSGGSHNRRAEVIAGQNGRLVCASSREAHGTYTPQSRAKLTAFPMLL